MPIYKYRGRGKARAIRKRRYGKRKVTMPKRKTLRKMVKAEVSRNIENKCRQYFDATHDLYAAGAAAGTLDVENVFPLTPSQFGLDISQGTGQGSRIGNVINIKKLTFKGTLIPKPAGDNYPEVKPLQIKMFLIYDKLEPTQDPTPSTNSDFFQFNGTAIGIPDDLTALWQPVNTDRYRVLAARTFKLGWASAIAFGSGANGYKNWSNNDFSLNRNFSIDVTKHIVKKCLYRDNNVDPTTRGLYAMFVVVGADGQPLGSGSPCALRYMLDCRFEDA